MYLRKNLLCLIFLFKEPFFLCSKFCPVFKLQIYNRTRLCDLQPLSMFGLSSPILPANFSIINYNYEEWTKEWNELHIHLSLSLSLSHTHTYTQSLSLSLAGLGFFSLFWCLISCRGRSESFNYFRSLQMLSVHCDGIQPNKTEYKATVANKLKKVFR